MKMYLLSLVLSFGLLGDIVAPGNPTCGPLSPKKKPCTVASKKYYRYTIVGEVTCDGSEDIDDRGISPEPYGRAYTQLFFKKGSGSTEYDARDTAGSSRDIYNHENDPWYACRDGPLNRFILYGRDISSTYPYIRVYNASCKGSGQMKDSGLRAVGMRRTWEFDVWKACEVDSTGYHYHCPVSLNLNLGVGKWKKQITEKWEGKSGRVFGKYETSGRPTWATDQDNNRDIDIPWTPGPLKDFSRETCDLNSKKGKKEKETKKKQKEKTE